MYKAGDIVSMNEIREQFENGDLEILARKELVVEVALYRTGQHIEDGRGFGVQLSFEKINKKNDEDTIYGIMGSFIDGETVLEDVLDGFAIDLDEKIWKIAEEATMPNLDDPNFYIWDETVPLLEARQSGTVSGKPVNANHETNMARHKRGNNKRKQRRKRR